MALTIDKWKVLRKIALKPLTAVDLPTNKAISDVQDLARLGYVRDYGQQYGRRIPINLRIWGITSAGKAVLEQQALTESKGNQPSLSLAPKTPLPKPIKRYIHGHDE